MSIFEFRSMRMAIACVSCSFILAGCSNSNNSQPSENTGSTVESANNDASGTNNPANTPADDPMMVSGQTTTGSVRVDFDIEVPVYKSNALLVKLVWGDTDVQANWIADESWAISVDLPTKTEHLLSVTFNDNNGDIVLGSFESNFKTGANATESYKITADQFDTARWDTDGDGFSNIAELTAGTDPLVSGSPNTTSNSINSVQ